MYAGFHIGFLLFLILSSESNQYRMKLRDISGRVAYTTGYVYSIWPQEEQSSAICFEALKTLQQTMEDLLLSEKNPKISLVGINSFCVDIKRCESVFELIFR